MRTAASRPVLVAVLLGWSVATFAADLLEVFTQAASADATYAAARDTWAAAQERIPQGRAGLLPLASLTASSQYNDREIRFRDSSLPRSNSGFGSGALSLTVTQPLLRPQNVIVYQQALTQVQQADAQLALAAQDLMLRVSQAYFDVLLADDNVALAVAQKTAIARQLEQAKRNFEVGVATITDTHEAQARYDLVTAQEIAARNEYDLRRRALEQLTGRPAPPLARLGPRFTLRPVQPATMEPWVTRARESNLQVRIAESTSVFAAQEIARNRAAHYPTVDAFASASGTGVGSGVNGGPGNTTRAAVLGVQLELPIYQGGAVNSRVREAIANQARASNDLEGARRAAEFSARQSYLGVSSGIAQVQALEAALVSTSSQLESTRLGQEVGVRTQVDVLNAQQLLFSARRDLAQARYNYVLSILRLEAAIGELTENDLTAVNAWLDNTAHTATHDLAAPDRSARGEPLERAPNAAPAHAASGADRTRVSLREIDWADVMRTLAQSQTRE